MRFAPFLYKHICVYVQLYIFVVQLLFIYRIALSITYSTKLSFIIVVILFGSSSSPSTSLRPPLLLLLFAIFIQTIIFSFLSDSSSLHPINTITIQTILTFSTDYHWLSLSYRLLKLRLRAYVCV